MIKVPEFKQSNTTPDELLLYLYQSSHYITNALAKGISMNNLHEPVGVLLNIGLKFLNISKSIQCLLSVAQDSISCFCLLRTQADYLSSLYLIFEKSKKNPNDCKFRYLLYFLDGFQSRHEVLTEHVKLENNGSITDEDFRQNHLLSLGNFLLLSEPHNESIGNKPFALKRSTYNQLKQQREIQVLTESDGVWTRDKIGVRKDKIVKFVLEHL